MTAPVQDSELRHKQSCEGAGLPHRGLIVKRAWPGRLTGTASPPQITVSQTEKSGFPSGETVAGSVNNHNRDADGSLEWSSPQQPRGAQPEAPTKGVSDGTTGDADPAR